MEVDIKVFMGAVMVFIAVLLLLMSNALLAA
jgi:hypothetical protein